MAVEPSILTPNDGNSPPSGGRGEGGRLINRGGRPSLGADARVPITVWVKPTVRDYWRQKGGKMLREWVEKLGSLGEG